MENPYGHAIAGGTMRGRGRLVQRLLSELHGETPAHVKIVGPKLSGKTIFMKAVSEQVRAGGAYAASCYWDLRRNTPKTDAEFRRQLADLLCGPFVETELDFAAELQVADEQLGAAISTLLDILGDEGHRIVVFMDGFDALLIGTDISANLLDNLLDYARKPSFWIVTASRRPLQELCNTDESATSDFWEVFLPTPVSMGPLERNDWPAILEPLTERGNSFDAKAVAALERWTGGAPVLVVQVLRLVWDATSPTHEVGADEIDAAAGSLLRESRSLLARLLQDCPEDTRTDLHDLASGSFKASQVSHSRRQALLERGYAREEGKQLQSSCELMARYVVDEHQDARDLHRAFAAEDDYRENLPKLLELRLRHVQQLDAKLSKLALESVQSLSDMPESAVHRVRAVVQRALTVIFEKELNGTDIIPNEWLEEWKHNGRLPSNINVQRGILPGGSGPLVRILQLAVAAIPSRDGGWDMRRTAKNVSRQSYYLLSHLHEVGNFGQHLDEDIHRAFAASVCSTILGLCESLSADFSPRSATELEPNTSGSRALSAGQ